MTRMNSPVGDDFDVVPDDRSTQCGSVVGATGTVGRVEWSGVLSRTGVEVDRGGAAYTWWWIAAGVLVSALMRARMLSTPLTADEGGYLAIARAWGHGRVLYRDVWVDRPQGLLLIYRLWDRVFGGGNVSVHLMAVVFGGVLVVSTAIVVREVAGQRAARATAIVCGVVSACPVLEAYIPNGEILSGALAAAGMAVCLVGLSRAHPLRWCYAAGVLAGAALSVKQSGFDGFLALLVTFGLVGAVMPQTRRRLATAAGALTAGVASVMGALMIHAALTGWWRWWFAVAGYRSQTLSVLNNPSWARLRDTARFGLVVLGLPFALAVLAGVGHLVRSRRSLRSVVGSRSMLLVTWLAAAELSFLIGGGYWRHYWLLLCAPVSAVAGVAVAQLRRPAGLMALLVLVPSLIITGWVYVGDPATITVRASGDGSPAVNQAIADWFLAHRRVGDNLYVLCDSPAIYADAHQDPGVAYLWYPEFYLGPHAHQRLMAYMNNTAKAPEYIVQLQSPRACDPTGQLATVLAKSYQEVTRKPATILQRRH